MPSSLDQPVTHWLRQREPMLFVSRVIHWETGRLVAERRPTLSSHLVTLPTTGECTETLLLEAMGQAAELLYRVEHERLKDKGYLVRIDGAQFVRRPRHDETLCLEARLVHVQFDYVASRCQARVMDEVIASAHMTHFYIRGD